MVEKKTAFPPPIHCRSSILDFAERSYVMGVLNVTPDSFSDGGMFFDREQAAARGVALVEEGADVLDVGGESTRPGAAPVGLAEELERVIPVIRELAGRVDVPISIDTTKAEVARQALDAGAEIVNDVSALRSDPDMAGVVSQSGAPVVLMHMIGTPQTMQQNTRYENIIDEIYGFLEERVRAAVENGIAPDKIIIDPGIGFGKSVETDNFTILACLEAFKTLGRPILVGPSRKAFIGRLLGKQAHEREAGTAAAVAIAVGNGADMVRVHDVATMRMVARVADKVRRAAVEERSA